MQFLGSNMEATYSDSFIGYLALHTRISTLFMSRVSPPKSTVYLKAIYIYMYMYII